MSKERIMKRDHHEFMKATGGTDIGCALFTYACNDGLKAEFISDGEDGFFRVYFAKESECEIPDYYEKTKEIKGCSWIGVFDDCARIFHAYTSGKDVSVYQRGRSYLIIVEGE